MNEPTPGNEARAGFVTVVGRPNVGKSTLINRIVGQKVAIVTSKPQTTRNRILAIANRAQAQVIFYDTPGIHKPMHRMNRVMVDIATSSLSRVDIALLVVDASQDYGKGDAYVLELIRKARRSLPVLLAINKIDLITKEVLLPLIAGYNERFDFRDIVPISAQVGDNVDRLTDVIVRHLPEGPPLYPEDVITDLPERFFVSEIVREKILNHTREELPYATAVIVDDWQDDDGLTRIEASIVVERASQKAIVLGKNGSMIKRIGTEARHEIEEFLGTRVYIGLHVKVRGDWRDNPRMLGELGIRKD